MIKPSMTWVRMCGLTIARCFSTGTEGVTPKDERELFGMDAIDSDTPSTAITGFSGSVTSISSSPSFSSGLGSLLLGVTAILLGISATGCNLGVIARTTGLSLIVVIEEEMIGGAESLVGMCFFPVSTCQNEISIIF